MILKNVNKLNGLPGSTKLLVVFLITDLFKFPGASFKYMFQTKLGCRLGLWRGGGRRAFVLKGKGRLVQNSNREHNTVCKYIEILNTSDSLADSSQASRG